MYYADIKEYDVANGPGIRISLFVSGCTHHCKGCFNEVAWNFKYGSPFTEEEIEKIINYMNKDYISGITILGGEPFEYINQKGILPLIKKIRKIYPEKSIWVFSGYLFDKDIMGRMINEYNITKELVENIDVIVDGKFELKNKNLSLKFRGSSNQRIIDVKKSLYNKKVILIDELMQ